MRFGDKVTYVPAHLADDPARWEHGIVKRETPDGNGYFVVYNCGGDWENFQDYTAANTNKRDLKPGWLDKEAYILLMPKGKEISDGK
jgi:hypothetical protein